MIIVKLYGGLGNQMFQYAFGRRLAIKHGTELKLDVQTFSDTRWNNPPRTYDLGIFNITENFASEEEIGRLAKRTRIEIADRVLNRILGVKESHIREPHYHFSTWAYNSPDNVYLEGYWQSEKYFEDIEEELRRDFTFKAPMHENAVPIHEQIRATESVCVHVRRTDFVTNTLSGYFGVDYYKAAEEIVLEHTSSPNYFVFSDDIEWCVENLSFRGETVFVSDDFGQFKARDDLRLMSLCKHLIIANSSFSWWAAWLGKKPGRTVVAPRRWVTDPSYDTKDLFPKGWITL